MFHLLKKYVIIYLVYIYAHFGGKKMDIKVGDKVEMKKQHPCGSKEFEILRIGMDFKIKCCGCGREVMVPRSKVEKNIKHV